MTSTDKAKAHLRLDGDAEDDWLAVFIPVVMQAIIGWVRDAHRLYEPARDTAGAVIYGEDGLPELAQDTGGDYILQPAVEGALLIELARLYRFREGESPDGAMRAEGGYTLGAGATSLLAPYRRHVVA